MLLILFACLPLGFGLAAAADQLPDIRLSSTRLAPGDVALITVAPADLMSGYVVWDRKTIPLVRLGEKNILTAFVAISQDEKPGGRRLPVVLVNAGQQIRRRLEFAIRAKDFPVQHLTLPQEKVSLSRKNLERHWREKAAIKNALARLRPLEDRAWQRSFRRPVEGEVSTPFGVRRVLNGKPRNSHSGVDLRGRAGEPVAASSDGIVILTGEHFFAGNSVYIDHGMGLVTMYFHLSEIMVKSGERVQAGQTIGLLGSTGRSTAPHLHWGLRVHNRPADPLSLLALFPLP
jgi:murein DD-endopeptidase MepM/ murein hydrolase activator NlpD